MKNLVFILLCLGLAQGAHADDFIQELRVSAIEQRDSVARSERVRPKVALSTFSFGPFASVLMDTASGGGFAIDFSSRLESDEPLSVGMYLAYAKMDTLRGAPISGYHLLPTLTYVFERSSPHAIAHFYLGLAAGVAFMNENFQNAGVPGTYFEFLFRPGVRIGTSQYTHFTLEPKLGILAAKWVFMPQLSVGIPF